MRHTIRNRSNRKTRKTGGAAPTGTMAQLKAAINSGKGKYDEHEVAWYINREVDSLNKVAEALTEPLTITGDESFYKTVGLAEARKSVKKAFELVEKSITQAKASPWYNLKKGMEIWE